MSTSYQDLLAKRAELDKQAADLEKQLINARNAERAAVIADIKTLLAKNGLTVADLGIKAGEGKGRGMGKGQTVPPKYRNPENGKTWSGRGIKPKWVADALTAGKSLQDLKI